MQDKYHLCSFMVYFWFQLVFCFPLGPRGSRWPPLLLGDLHKLVLQLALFLLRVVVILIIVLRRRYLYLSVVVKIPIWHSILLLLLINNIWRETECPHIGLRLCPHLWGVNERVLNGYISVVNVKVRRVLISGYVGNIANIHSWHRVVLTLILILRRLLTHLLRLFWIKLLRLRHTQRNPSSKHIILLFCYLFL
jgi:hypothetical protein